MSLKKLAVVVLAGLLVTAVSAMAQEDCDICNKCFEPSWDAGGCEGTEQTGYECTTYDPNCDPIFDICDCIAAGNLTEVFELDDIIGVKLTSLTPGVYFTDGEIGLRISSSRNAICGTASGISVVEVTPVGNYDDYQWHNSEDIDSSEGSPTMLDGDDLVPEGSNECVDTNPERAVVVTTGNTGYIITQADLDANRKYWQVVLPELAYDPQMVTKGAVVQIRVELTTEGGTNLCSDCQTLCECIWTGPMVCKAVVTTSSIYFPYVLTEDPAAGASWATGIVVSDMTFTAGSLFAGSTAKYLTFKMVDGAGNEYTKTLNNVTDTLYVNNMGQMVKDFGWNVGDTTTGILAVTANYPIDGYQFNLSLTPGTIFGAGVLPRSTYKFAWETGDW
ncbi:MAG: hypothetical protein CSA22_04000 [Deltaproteobacteria bacterium]|nr:MAG: hypothetical protein CSA22_04000 [Deltaproteobacteria bacterium]